MHLVSIARAWEQREQREAAGAAEHASARRPLAAKRVDHGRGEQHPRQLRRGRDERLPAGTGARARRSGRKRREEQMARIASDKIGARICTRKCEIHMGVDGRIWDAEDEIAPAAAKWHGSRRLQLAPDSPEIRTTGTVRTLSPRRRLCTPQNAARTRVNGCGEVNCLRQRTGVHITGKRDMDTSLLGPAGQQRRTTKHEATRDDQKRNSQGGQRKNHPGVRTTLCFLLSACMCACVPMCDVCGRWSVLTHGCLRVQTPAPVRVCRIASCIFSWTHGRLLIAYGCVCIHW
eukprot:6184854-Pleurochrysis_carterae.AAC.1